MSEAAPLTRDAISAAIAEKAWKDEAFHRDVLANPNAVYEKFMGHPLPPGVAIKVVEDTTDTVHFVIPAKPAHPGELSDAELEGVAGGATPLLLGLSAAGTFFSLTAVGGVTKKSGAVIMTRDEIGAAIARKAWADEAFHQAVLSNPAKVYEEQLGRSLPPGLSIKVLEDTPTLVHFVLPTRPPQTGALSDAELENVAGGFTPLLAVGLTGGLGVMSVAVGVAEGRKSGW